MILLTRDYALQKSVANAIDLHPSSLIEVMIHFQVLTSFNSKILIDAENHGG